MQPTDREDLAETISALGGIDDVLDHGGFDSHDSVPEGDTELEDLAATMLTRWNEYREARDYFMSAVEGT